VPAPAGNTTAHHTHDLDGVACFESHFFVRRSFDDGSVVLDGDRAGVHAKLLEVSQQRRRALELDFFSVDLQGDHWNMPMAA
jgi:hypothetical protein